jgi:hypothetical protein
MPLEAQYRQFKAACETRRVKFYFHKVPFLECKSYEVIRWKVLTVSTQCFKNKSLYDIK